MLRAKPQTYAALDESHVKQSDTYDEIQPPTLNERRQSTVVPFPKPPPRLSLSAGAGKRQREAIEDTIPDSIDKDIADDMLLRAGMSDGMYVLRKSRSHMGSYVLCVAEHGLVRHYPVERCDDMEGFRLLSPEPPRHHASLEDVLRFYSHTKDGLTVLLKRRITK